MGTSTNGRRRILHLLAAGGLLLGLTATLTGGLASCSADKPAAEASRPLNKGELERLAGMRARNFADGRVGLRGTIGPGSRQTKVDGWVDWKRQLVYLSVSGTGAGASTVLIQATPGVVAMRPGALPAPAASGPAPESARESASPAAAASSAAAAVPAGKPPLTAPEDGWRVRPLQLGGDEERPIDNLVAFLFLLAKQEADPTGPLGELRNEWVRRDTFEGAPVDVLLGPALLPQAAPSAPPSASAVPSPSVAASAGVSASAATAPRTEATTAPSPGDASPAPSPGSGASAGTDQPATASGSPSPAPDPKSLEANGGAVGYWLNAKGALVRLETVLGDGLPSVLDLQRGQQQEFVRTMALGGRDHKPTEITKAEAKVLSQLRQRNLKARGGAVTVTMPVLPGALRIGKGWLDWQKRLAYLAVRDVDDESYDVLLHADRTGIAIRKPGKRVPEQPPLPAPTGKWERAEWVVLGSSGEITDMDYLIYEALSLAANVPDDADHIRKHGRRLRVDVLNKVPVGVFELPSAVETNVPAGQARMRYWVDNAGVLKRLELRTATGGFAQLDLDLSEKPPTLPMKVK
ncbi:hypothetical protein [Catellatospora citrea]|uniref:Uncharacterized protein n=1 Tax=Catellatospora citrea TaxID=53366 RepID=A0A8J3K1R2_9ACTN|nr:hypothetical protein [Catellatospora citrea]RKE07000.1 hypothetical protein C8E86_1824 [Catellatospora citrea]GIF95151.1 hypothetical protein Cci01nite_02450 [Catellatospora citrea]